MREVDRLMIEQFAISLEQMMENAGRNLALLARAMLGGDVRGRRMRILAGSGGNGGGGLAAARHLLAAGADVSITLATPPERLAPVTRKQYDTLARLDVRHGEGLDDEELVIDALLGYSQKGAPTGEIASLIRRTAGAPVLALDVPSGLELESGRLHDPHVRAAATLTLALPKQGLRSEDAVAVIGDLYLGDLSVQPAVYERLDIRYSSPFGRSPLVRIDALAQSTA